VTEALQTIIHEFKILSPDIANTLVFRLNGEAIAAEGATPEQIQTLISHLNGITHADCIGGLENLIIQDMNTQLSVTGVEEIYLATVSARGANQEIVKSLTEIVAPTVIRLAFASTVSTAEKIQPSKDDHQIDSKEAVSLPDEEPEIESIPEPQEPPEPFLPKPPIIQFMVERIEGILVPVDTVRIGTEVIKKWQDLYDGKQFTHVSIETLEGKTVTCKCKPLKGPRTNVKGIIQLPERIIQMLAIGKGKLVMVKPVIQ
jgi:hypothetical protein